MADFPNFVLDDFEIFGDNIPLFCDMEPTARFAEVDVGQLDEMRSNNSNKNTQKSTKTWMKVFDLWRAERSEARKLEDIPEDELDFVLCRFYAEIRKILGR